MTKLSDIFTDPCKHCNGTAGECFDCQWAAWPFVDNVPLTAEEHEHQKHADWMDEQQSYNELRRGE